MKQAEKAAAVYTKEQLLRFERYKGHRDLVAALLEEKPAYTLAQVDERINQFLRKG